MNDTRQPAYSGAFSRRKVLLASAAALTTATNPMRAKAHSSFGPVTPRQAPPVALRLSPTDGKPAPLKELLSGRITAVQLMFTGCSATCPIQGAIFADAQARLAQADRRLRLLSITIDPLNDDVPALARWLGRFGALPARWTAAMPRVQDVDPLLDFLRGRATGADSHTAQAFMFDRTGRLAFRTVDMPPGGELVRLMQELAAAG